MEAIFKEMKRFQKNELPLLFIGNEKCVLFELAIKENKTIERFLYFMLKSDPKGILYNDIIVRNLEKLF